MRKECRLTYLFILACSWSAEPRSAEREAQSERSADGSEVEKDILKDKHLQRKSREKSMIYWAGEEQR